MSSPPNVQSSGSKLHFEDTTSIGNETFLLSSSPSRLDHAAINAALADPALFWARALSPEHLATMLENSFCLGLYVLDDGKAGPRTESKTTSYTQDTSSRQIGFARLITDHVTFAWLTDVYVLPAYQRRGLARWMNSALDSVLSGMPELRRAMLIAETGRMSAEYQKSMGCDVWENGSAICMQKRGPAGGSLGMKDEEARKKDTVS